MTDQALEINIIYNSSAGRDVTFTDIVTQRDAMDPEDYEPEPFWMLTGGFQVTINEHQTIFRSCDFHYLIKATSFLIHSLYWLKSKSSNWFQSDDDFPNDVIVKSTGGNLVRLRSVNEDELELSYTSVAGTQSFRRGERFFPGVIISKAAWFEQANIALEEYFNTLVYVVANSTKTKTTKLMLEYLEVWKAISIGPGKSDL